MRKIQIVPLSQMEEMRKYFYTYLTELSKFDPDIKFDNEGFPIYQWYDCYWTDKNRYPLFLIIDNNIAGLALIRELDNMLYDFAEFYVCPKYRKDGNAIWFATEITNLFKGQFVFSTRFTNPKALKFWGKFAQLFGSNEYKDDDIWRNWIIRKTNFKTHTLNLQPLYFDLIKNGQKTLEGRLYDDKRKDFNIGDKIIFYKEPDKIETIKSIILDKYLYNNFEDMATHLNKNELGFANKTKDEMINTYRSFYPKENEKKFGVVVFKIKTLL